MVSLEVFMFNKEIACIFGRLFRICQLALKASRGFTTTSQKGGISLFPKGVVNTRGSNLFALVPAHIHAAHQEAFRFPLNLKYSLNRYHRRHHAGTKGPDKWQRVFRSRILFTSKVSAPYVALLAIYSPALYNCQLSLIFLTVGSRAQSA